VRKSISNELRCNNFLHGGGYFTKRVQQTPDGTARSGIGVIAPFFLLPPGFHPDWRTQVSNASLVILFSGLGGS
jgi:hypothetical protein